MQRLVFFWSLPAALLGGFADPGAAATVFTGQNITIRATAPQPVGFNLWAVTLSAVGQNGALPRVFDGTNSGQGGTGITTPGLSLHQIWEGGFSSTPNNTLAVPGSIPQTLDTHFLVDTNKIFSAQFPSENRLVINTAAHPFGGFGNSLTGAFSLIGPVTSSWDFAYLVMPHGALANLHFEVGSAGFPSEIISASMVMSSLVGDLNLDGAVNIFDVNVVSNHWDEAGPEGDANGDGVVDIFDVNVISANWTDPQPGSPPVAEPSGAILFLVALGAAAMCYYVSAVPRLQRTHRSRP